MGAHYLDTLMAKLRPHSGYNPPKYVTDAAKEALDKVDCNQYAPTKVRFLCEYLQKRFTYQGGGSTAA